MNKYEIAVKLAMMFINENSQNSFTLEDNLHGAVVIFDTLDTLADTYIKLVEERIGDYDDFHTEYEWELIALADSLKEYRDELQAHTDIR